MVEAAAADTSSVAGVSSDVDLPVGWWRLAWRAPAGDDQRMTTALAPLPEPTTITGRAELRAIVAVTGVADDAGDPIESGAFREVIEAPRGDRWLPHRTANGAPWLGPDTVRCGQADRGAR